MDCVLTYFIAHIPFLLLLLFSHADQGLRRLRRLKGYASPDSVLCINQGTQYCKGSSSWYHGQITSTTSGELLMFRYQQRLPGYNKAITFNAAGSFVGGQVVNNNSSSSLYDISVATSQVTRRPTEKGYNFPHTHGHFRQSELET
ncbi:hypothetical protein J3E72DRAFT_265588 [Bipolaris maydis]|nr:hypothetical protein J3E72DRAFT_265588 [Bipolaris maydis]